MIHQRCGAPLALAATIGLSVCVISPVRASDAPTAASAITAPASSFGSSKSVRIREIDDPPRIDGTIEPMWLSADSISDFVQNQPYEKTDPTERTTVYLLQDEENLYVAFRFYARHHPPTADYTKDEDYAVASIDPFGSRTMGYFFQVFGSGIFYDGILEDDGRVQDQSWDGVWYHADRLYADRMEVEMKIPFKTIRYKKGLSTWGIQFRRHIAVNAEDDYWTEVAQKDGDLISRWGSATGLQPHTTGHNVEFYPEGFIRHDDTQGESSRTKPNGSFNMKWDFTPQTSLSATSYPDFAQIESDPFTLNLSRYETFYAEQRPFFVEGSEIFRFSSFPNSGFFQPLNIFYSRRIGKIVGSDAVPIIGGVKLTHKTADWDIGALGAATESDHNEFLGIQEPRRNFGAFRADRRILGNSNFGILGSGMAATTHDYDYAVGSDAVLRSGPSELIVQGAASNHNGKRGYAFTSGFKGFTRSLLTLATYEAVGDSFDVQDIGYVPWTGQQKLLVLTGPYWTFTKGWLRDLWVAPGIVRDREPGSPRWTTLAYFEMNPDLRRNWSADIEASYGRAYEYDDLHEYFVGYIEKSISVGIFGLMNGNSLNENFNYTFGFNYVRHYLDYQATNSISYNYSIIPPLRVALAYNHWIEWDPHNAIVAETPSLRPLVDYRFSPLITLTLFNELVGSTPGSALSRTRLQSDRVGGLFSWNFAPKSWLYAALNDYGALDFSTSRSGIMKRQYGIGAVKVKYLLYF